MLINTKQTWGLPESAATAENHYLARRKFIKKAGFEIIHSEHLGWGVPIWKVDPIFRKHKIFDDMFESIGRKLFYSQATSLYIVLKKE